MKVVLLAIGAGIAWGSGQILVKVGMRTIDPITGIAIRLTTAWLVAMAILFCSRIRQWEGLSFNPKGAAILAVEGMVGPMLGMFLVLAAYRVGGEVKTAAPISLTVPIIWSALLAFILFHEQLTLVKVIGILIAVIGVGLVALF
jgi:uncharacterized membrane protein